MAGGRLPPLRILSLGYVGAVINRPHSRVLRIRTGTIVERENVPRGRQVAAPTREVGSAYGIRRANAVRPYGGIRFGEWNSAAGQLPRRGRYAGERSSPLRGMTN